MKIKIGVIFGGVSKEREISFAGGRTVYDNLNKSLFEAVPVFVDSFGNFILLDWQYVYKGSIRDFYPPVEFIPSSKNEFQVYAESLGEISREKQEEIIKTIGQKLSIEDFKDHFDLAFLCLHGPFGEDGKIQGLLDYYGIPYTGSGILPSAIGIDKAVQKQLMSQAGFAGPSYFIIERNHWNKKENLALYEKAKKDIGFPLVVKAATQGSSIGVSIIKEDNSDEFIKAVTKSFFSYEIIGSEWKRLSEAEQTDFVRTLVDIREGIGIPLKIGELVIHHPDELLEYLNKFLSDTESLLVESLDGERQVIVEQFIEGKEFSCIVIQDENNEPVALPPTEIRKGKELFDYRSKYLPGLSRKITPIDLPEKQIENIRKECEKLFSAFKFDVYARIDGFISDGGKVFLNDPNTTSGMMPSSFFFHQAAEIGLNPSQFLTYIIRTSLQQRSLAGRFKYSIKKLLKELDEGIEGLKKLASGKRKIAVLLGGFSSERHISVESGRNIYEKLASSSKYEPIPVFLTGDEKEHLLYQIPINVLLKDNADDIKEKVNNYHVHPVIESIMERCAFITKKYASVENLAEPQLLDYVQLAGMVDGVFIALHGRPGEDGAVQEHLEKVGLPYNGSDVVTSNITINKYQTNEILKTNGFLVADHMLMTKEEWQKDPASSIKKITSFVKFPFIAKPVDDGCSSAVKKIKNVQELEAFANLIFRETEELDAEYADVLHLKAKEEFPVKDVFLVEELISKKNARHFLEITGGLLTTYSKKGKLRYEVFEASEALSEGEVLSLEEKFLAGQGQNITPARYADKAKERKAISEKVKEQLGAAAKVLNIQGYARIDAFVRIYDVDKIEVIFVEVNSLPGMTPATCIFHQTAINGYKPFDFIDKILEFGFERRKKVEVGSSN